MASDKELVAKYEKEGKETGLDPAYVYELCVDVYTDQMEKAALYKPKSGMPNPMERQIKSYMKHWKCTRERAEQRYRDHAQIYSPTIRSTLKVLAARGEAPKAATKKDTKK